MRTFLKVAAVAIVMLALTLAVAQQRMPPPAAPPEPPQFTETWNDTVRVISLRKPEMETQMAALSGAAAPKPIATEHIAVEHVDRSPPTDVPAGVPPVTAATTDDKPAVAPATRRHEGRIRHAYAMSDVCARHGLKKNHNSRRAVGCPWRQSWRCRRSKNI